MERRLLAYVWRGEVTEEDAKKLTHINVAFGSLFADGRVDGQELATVKQIPQIRKWNPNIKIVLSVQSGEPSAWTVVAANPELRRTAAGNWAKLARECDLDGIDLDWEYPCVPSNGTDFSKEDKHNFTLLLQDIRAALDEEFPEEHKILSIATGADVYYVHCVEMVEIEKVLDYICVMTYDLKCGFHALSGHHTPLYSNVGDVFMNSCDQALRLFHESGIPREKLLMGCAFYSRMWENVTDRYHGLLQYCKNGGGYGPRYTELVESYINKNGYVRYWDDEAKAPYLFNGSTFISYDDPQSLTEKSKYVLAEEYGGMFYWEHRCDETRTLLDTIYREYLTK